jgi:hypothetical protein
MWRKLPNCEQVRPDGARSVSRVPLEPDVDAERGRFPGSKDAARVPDREHSCSRKSCRKVAVRARKRAYPWIPRNPVEGADQRLCLREAATSRFIMLVPSLTRKRSEVQILQRPLDTRPELPPARITKMQLISDRGCIVPPKRPQRVAAKNAGGRKIDGGSLSERRSWRLHVPRFAIGTPDDD